MNSMQTKSPEERRASAAKGHATRRRNKEAREAKRKEAERREVYLKDEIEALERQRRELIHHRMVDDISHNLTGKGLLTEKEIICGAVNSCNTCGVYFLIKYEKIIYVGQSINIFARVSTHSKEKDFDRFAYIKFNPEMLDKVESLYIHLLRPTMNGNMRNGIKLAPLSLAALLHA